MAAGRQLYQVLWLSILASVLTLGLKTTAYLFTGSISLLSDAAESIVNLAAALVAFVSLRYARVPLDSSHPFGHEKIEYFSSGLEGGLILMAALAIAWFAIDRLIHPRELASLDLGLALSIVAASINACVALLLLRLARKHRSIVLEADGQHLLTDVWTTAGMLVGLGLVWITQQYWLDPVIAMIMSGAILWTALSLVRRSFDGLMDRALPNNELLVLRQVIEANMDLDMSYHALRTRQAGATRFVEFHLLVPGTMSVQAAHHVTDNLTEQLRAALMGVEVLIHIEPIEDRSSYEDNPLVHLEGDKGGLGINPPRDT